jgi:hypothetical protein
MNRRLFFTGIALAILLLALGGWAVQAVRGSRRRLYPGRSPAVISLPSSN